MIERNVNCVDGSIVTNGKAQVTNGAGAIGFNQNIFGFEISMRDSRFTYYTNKIRSISFQTHM